MEYYGKFDSFPLGSALPGGWIKQTLERFRQGLTGKLEGAGYPFGIVDWHHGWDRVINDCQWEPYEQTAYWIDGLLKTALLLDDRKMLFEALERFDYLKNNRDKDSYLGPVSLKKLEHKVTGGTEDYIYYAERLRWPFAVLFRAWMSTGKESAAHLIKDHYVNDSYDYSIGRDVLNLEAALMAARILKDEDLRNIALNWYSNFSKAEEEKSVSPKGLSGQSKSEEHGVTYCEMGKLPAIAYLFTGDRDMLNASVQAWKKIDRFHMLVDGVPSSSEHLRGKEPLDSHETCVVADYCWSSGFLLMATGDMSYADKIERAIFNAGFGSIKNDAKALQYFSCPNQVIADSTSNHNKMFRASSHMSFRANPGTPCCPGNVNRIFPQYAERMWLSKGQKEICAVLYGASTLKTKIDEINLEIIQETDYPFGESVNFTINPDKPVFFSFWMRIPEWCSSPSLKINGQELALPSGKSLIEIKRRFGKGDTITLILPMELAFTNWGENGQAIERGPLVYSLEIEEKWIRDYNDQNQSEDLPAWNVYAESPWNYAIEKIDSIEDLKSRVKITHRPGVTDLWGGEEHPIEIEMEALKVPKWDLQELDLKEGVRGHGDLKNSHELNERICLGTPDIPDLKGFQPETTQKEKIKLVPYGRTHLRLTIFPTFVVDNV